MNTPLETPPPSPCIGVCQLDANGLYCLGCLRNLQEIAEWSGASNDRKQAILARIASTRNHAKANR